jgi:EAL domain-containing protein (putative c-di-GMP-specific phosphodiesterase class I)
MESMDEKLRLKELEKYNISYDIPDPCFTELAEIAKHVINVPISGISIVDEHNVWLKARVGVDITCLKREGAFCSYAIENNSDQYIVEDTYKNKLFIDNPLVVESGIRFYGSAVLRNKQGFNIGTLWVMDTKPRTLTSTEVTLLKSLASQSIRLLESRYINQITGLPNRITFTEKLQIAMNKCEGAKNEKDESNTNVVVGVIHIRNMDALESISGQSGITNIQKEIASRLTSLALHNYHVAHLNDDLFSFALEKSSHPFNESIDKITSAMAEPVTVNDYQRPALISIGLVESPLNGVNASSIITQAASVAQEMRNSKKEIAINRCAMISHSEYVKALHKELHVQSLALRPFYQPQVDIKHGQISGFEALARWNSDIIGEVSPVDFIAIAESSGLIVELDLHIFRCVYDDLNTWYQNKAELVPIAVNFSRLTLLSSNLITKIQNILKNKPNLCHFIKIEVTESIMLEESDPVQERIKILKEMGFKISIDDFGTGFSNLSTLKLLQFDQLKVDRQFIHGMSDSSHTEDLFLFIKNIAALFKANLMCEGMERENDIELLVKHNAQLMQGWYFSKAVPASKVEELFNLNVELMQKETRFDYKILATEIKKTIH